MKIVQLSPLYESVPPRLYGGTERVVSYLTEELVKMGHDVTLMASGDSITKAKLWPMCERATRLDRSCKEPVARHMLMVEQLVQEADRFDIIHSHIEFLFLPAFRTVNVPVIGTIHSRLDLPEMTDLYKEFREAPLVSISDAQRRPIPWANWQGTVYHGLPVDMYKPSYDKGEYLAFIGRLSPEKQPDVAIEIARRAKKILKIAAKVDSGNLDYFENHLRELIETSAFVDYLGEVGEEDKHRLLCGAKALLMSINWPEPFGLVMIEAMACGTPTIAFRHGSVPEIIEDGVNGYIVDTVEEAVEAVKKVDKLDRRVCREVFETRFTSTSMAEGYLEVYERLCEDRALRGIPKAAALSSLLSRQKNHPSVEYD